MLMPFQNQISAMVLTDPFTSNNYVNTLITGKPKLKTPPHILTVMTVFDLDFYTSNIISTSLNDSLRVTVTQTLKLFLNNCL